MVIISTDVEAPVETIAPNEIIYHEIPMNRLLDYSQSEVKTAFGEPMKSGSGLMLYDDLTFFFDPKSDKMEAINIREPGALSVYGYPEKNLEELGTLKIDSQDKSSVLKKELGVEPIVYGYENGAYKFEYVLSDYTMLNLCGEYSSAPCSVWFFDTESTASSELCYNGIAVNTLFELSYDDVLSIYGEPSRNPNASPEIYGGENYMYEVLNYPILDITYKFNRKNGGLISINDLNKELVTVNGAKLSEKPEEFSKALGDPVMSDTYSGRSALLYTFSNLSMEVISGTEGTTDRINIISSKNKIPYNIENLIPLIGSSSENVYLNLGIPVGGTSLRENGSTDEKDNYIYDQNLYVFFNRSDPITVDWISFNTKIAEKNGETLDKTRDELIKILGAPDHERYDEDYYYMNYVFDLYGAVLSLSFPDYNGKAAGAIISEYIEENYYDEPEPEPSDSSYYTADGYTLTVGNIVYAEESLTGLNYVEGYVTSIDGDKATVQWEYIYVNCLWAYRKFRLYDDGNMIFSNYIYIDNTETQRTTYGVKTTYTISELYGQIPEGETIIG